MMKRSRTRIAVGISIALSLAGVLAAPSSAFADGVSTTTAFVNSAPVAVDFGSNWLITIKVTTNDYPVNLDGTYGTVDVFLSGITGAYAAGLPLQPGGLAYFSQPSSKPNLAAGTYNVTATFQPSSGGGLKTSQTTTPLALTVSALAANATVSVVDDPSKASVPTISAAFSGPYVDKNGGAPAGVWAFTVTDSSGRAVYTSKIAQASGSTKPLVIGIDNGIKQGTTYTVASTFTPSADVAGGITLGKIADTTFTSADGSLGDKLAAPVPMPVWLFIVILVFALALVVATVLFARRNALAPKVTTRPGAPQQRGFATEPDPADLLSLSDVGLATTATETTHDSDWSLANDAPTQAMDTPTVKLDAPPSATPIPPSDPTPTTTNPGASSD